MNNLPFIFTVIVYMFFASGFHKLMSITETAVGFQKRIINFGIEFINIDAYKLIIVLAAIWEIVAPIVLVYSGLLACESIRLWHGNMMQKKNFLSS